MRCRWRRKSPAGKSQSLGIMERNEVKRKIPCILEIRVLLACLSIYGGRGGLKSNRKYKMSSPSPTLLVVPIRLRNSGPMPVEYSDSIHGLLAGPCQPCVRILLYTIPARYIPSSCWYIMTHKEDEQLTSDKIRKGTMEIQGVVEWSPVNSNKYNDLSYQVSFQMNPMASCASSPCLRVSRLAHPVLCLLYQRQ